MIPLVSAQAAAAFATAPLGYARFDSGRYAAVDGALGTPSFEIATLAAFELDGPTNKTFNGLLALDAEGYVVWASRGEGKGHVSLQREAGGRVLDGENISRRIKGRGSTVDERRAVDLGSGL